MTEERPEGAFGKLIDELKDWNNGDGVDVDSWISCVGSVEHAIGYSRWFWPRFVLHDDCILHERFKTSNFDAFMKSSNGDRTRVEAVMNHWHIADLFQSEPSREQILYLGGVLRETWEAKLRRDFPDRKIVVHFPTEELDDLLHYEITAYQDRS